VCGGARFQNWQNRSFDYKHTLFGLGMGQNQRPHSFAPLWKCVRVVHCPPLKVKGYYYTHTPSNAPVCELFHAQNLISNIFHKVGVVFVTRWLWEQGQRCILYKLWPTVKLFVLLPDWAPGTFKVSRSLLVKSMVSSQSWYEPSGSHIFMSFGLPSRELTYMYCFRHVRPTVRSSQSLYTQRILHFKW
jgi:hypothetical protein